MERSRAHESEDLILVRWQYSPNSSTDRMQSFSLFCRIWPDGPKFHMGMQESQNSENILEQEEQS